jgi:glycosyltransferase involved in cell wall biosynthesis
MLDSKNIFVGCAMRVAVMLRTYDRPGGIGIYARNIIKNILKIDQKNQYVLIYNNDEHIGTYSGLKNVEEIYLKQSNPFIWDQWLVPKTLRQYEIDIVFNTKFSVPLSSNAKKVMVLHGSGWLMYPELWGRMDGFYQRKIAMPIYCDKADFLISNSDLTKYDFMNRYGIPENKIATTHLAQGDEFHLVEDQERLNYVINRYNLPKIFILTVTSYEKRKNFSTLIKAFELCRKKIDVDLVVIGKNCERYIEDFGMVERGLQNVVHFPGWVEQKDLPAIYSLSKAFAFPSIYEGFGIPVIEAISCGCPVVSSNTGAIPELMGNAAMLSEPLDHKKLAENLLHILTSESVFLHYRKLGLERSKNFSWAIAAQKTIDILNKVNANSPGQ